MARLSWVLFPAALLFIFVACGPSDVQEPDMQEEGQVDPEQVKQDVLADVWETVMQESNTEPKLPRNLETGERYLTARVNADSDGYEVFYYLMDEPVPVNDPGLEREEPDLTAGAIIYGSAEGARAGVNDEPEMETGEPADLGHGITGYVNADDGSARIVWQEDRWSFLVYQDGEGAVEEVTEQAEDLVSQMANHMLPVPQDVGAGTFDMSGDGASDNSIQWQEENVVYSVNFGEPLGLIEMVSKMNG